MKRANYYLFNLKNKQVTHNQDKNHLHRLQEENVLQDNVQNQELTGNVQGGVVQDLTENEKEKKKEKEKEGKEKEKEVENQA
jgi:hypothetical protein